MAVTTTSALYAGFIFDGVNSRDMGVYVQDVQVFGAPERDVEMVSIPGRDGEYALDRGRFANIEVTYTCALGAGAPEDFNDAISALRNWLASRVGYKRLEDEINTDEYRRAVFKDGLDVETINKQTGTFEVTFSCMPQRWLKSGETSQAVTSGGTIENPTLFSARPLLEVYGYGAIDIDGETVSINAGALGDVLVMNAKGRTGDAAMDAAASKSFELSGDMDLSQLNTGDSVNVGYSVSARLDAVGVTGYPTMTAAIISKTSGDIGAAGSGGVYGGWATFDVVGRAWAGTGEAFVKGTARTVTGEYALTIHYADGSQTPPALYGVYATLSVTLAYDGAEGLTLSATLTSDNKGFVGSVSLTVGGASGNSSKSALGEPAYLDLDIGEAYKIEGGAIVGINNGVTLPGDLPELAPGENTITFDATITGVNIVPRWWKV